MVAANTAIRGSFFIPLAQDLFELDVQDRCFDSVLFALGKMHTDCISANVIPCIQGIKSDWYSDFPV